MTEMLVGKLRRLPFSPTSLLQDPSRRAFAAVVGLALLNALFWTAFPLIGGSLNLHSDSYEAFVWGQEFQMGYYKHPPFWAWVAGLWFKIFPHKDWAFYLLSELNAALGLVGVWALLGRLTGDRAVRNAGTLLLLLTSFYTFNALRFNANTIQLSLWPWTLVAFLHTLETRSLRSGLFFGFMAACAMLSKYYGALLLFACLIATLTRRDKWDYLRSPAPWTALGFFALLVAPHVVWLFRTDFLPFSYASNGVMHGKVHEANFFLSIAFYLLLPLLTVIVCEATRRRKAPGEDAPPPAALDLDPSHGKAFVFVLGLLPSAMTLFIAALGCRIMPHYLIPAFPLAPFLVLLALHADAARVTRVTLRIYVVILVVALCAAPFVPGLVKRPFKPIHEVANLAIQEWKHATSAPLALVAGSQPYSEAVAFYAPGKVSEFIEFNTGYAPWVTPQRVKDQGLLAVCLDDDAECKLFAAHYETPETQTIRKETAPHWWRYKKAPLSFVVIVIPPQTTTPAPTAP